jgi:Domain of unknown function (DUF202)
MNEPAGPQAERTVLAWTRTVLLVAAVATLIARTADSGFERGVATSLAAAGLGLAVLTAMRRRVFIAGGDPVTAPAGRTFGGVLAALATLTVAGVVVIL